MIVHSAVAMLGDHCFEVASECKDALWAKSFSDYTGITKNYVFHARDILTAAAECAYLAMSSSQPDRIIVVTQTYEPRCPGLGFMLLRELQWNCPVIELNSACQGFMEAVELASNFFGRTLIVCADSLGSSVRSVPADRSVRHIFSDAVSACLVTDAADVKTVQIPEHADKLLIGHDEAWMEGEAINWCASRFVPELLLSFVWKGPALLHQANLSIIRRIEKRAGISSHVSIDKFANTSSSSIPLGLCDFVGSGGKLGDVLLCGYGAGFKASAGVVTLSSGFFGKILN